MPIILRLATPRATDFPFNPELGPQTLLRIGGCEWAWFGSMRARLLPGGAAGAVSMRAGPQS
jgi:hypothetical protein